MLGHPKYAYGDKVKFTIDGKEIIGTIEIIDAYGTFEQNREVSYDIMVKGEPWNMLYKHITENGVEKI